MLRLRIAETTVAICLVVLTAAPAFAGKPVPQSPTPPPSPSTICYSWSAYYWEANENGVVNSGVQLTDRAKAPSERRYNGVRWWLAIEDQDGDTAVFNPELFAYGVGPEGVTRLQVTSFYPVLRLSTLDRTIQWCGRTVDGVRSPDAFISVVAINESNTTSQLLRLSVSPAQLLTMHAAGELPLTPVSTGIEKVLVWETPIQSYPYRTARWSPDGHTLAYVSKDGSDNYSLRTVGEDGSNPLILVAGRRSLWDITVDWSPNGERIGFRSSQPAQQAGTRNDVNGMWVVPATGGTAVLVSDMLSDRLFWSPDGNWLALRVSLSNKVSPGGAQSSNEVDIVRIPSTGGSYVNLTLDITGQPDVYGWVQN